MRTVFHILIISILLIPGVSALEIDAVVDISEGLTTGTISSVGGEIWYNINLTGDYFFSLNGPDSTDFDLYIYLDNVQVDVADATSYPDVVTVDNTSGIYQLKVISIKGTGNFTLQVNNLYGSASNIPKLAVGGTINDTVSEIGILWYSVNLTGNYSFYLESAPNIKIKAQLLYVNLTRITNTEYGIYPNIMSADNLNGTYLLSFKNYDDISANFTFSIVDVGDQTGIFRDNPIDITVGLHSGYLVGSGDKIWYRVNLTGNYLISLDAFSDTDFDMYILNETGSMVNSARGTNYPENLFLYNYSGIYYIYVEAWANYGNFTLDINYYENIPGDHISNAIAINGSLYNESLPGPALSTDPNLNGSIWYNINLTGSYQIELQKLVSDDFIFNLLLENGTYISTSNYRNVIQATLNGSYFIQVIPNGYTGYFNLTFEERSHLPGFSIYNAIEITNNFITGSLPGVSFSNSNFYSFNANGFTKIELNGDDDTNFNINLIDGDNRVIEKSTGSTYPDIITSNEIYGVYYIEVTGYNAGKYSIFITNYTPSTNGTIGYPNMAVPTGEMIYDEGFNGSIIANMIFVILMVIGIGYFVYKRDTNKKLVKDAMKNSIRPYDPLNKSYNTEKVIKKAVFKTCKACYTQNPKDSSYCIECGSTL